jgi:superfamily II DNA or RNA helicase
MVRSIESQRTLRSRRLRAKIYLRADGRCEYCGSELKKDWQVDHYLSWARGGKTTMSNLRASCKECNLRKGNKEMHLNPQDYESMDHFKNDFPRSRNMRVCQIGAYNCAVTKLVHQRTNSCSIFLPTGTGKSDLVRALSIGLVQIRRAYAGVWAFSPSTELRHQLKGDKVDETLNRLGMSVDFNINPFMEEDSLDNKRFRNGCLMESFTTQYLTSNGNINLFIEQAKKIKRDTGLFPVAIFDESHLCSTDNQWGGAAKKLQSIGVPIVLVTGTPYRSDNLEIPGFILEDNGKEIKKFTRIVPDTNDPLLKKLVKTTAECCKFLLKADYAYPYKRAWDDGVILQPEPAWIDATVTTYDQTVSRMARTQSNRLLRAFLMDDKTVSEAVSACIKSLNLRKSADPECAALVTTLSDVDDVFDDSGQPDEFADIHAKKIAREFQRQCPSLKVLVVTSKTNAEDGLRRFKKGNYDVLIVKAMGTIGFDCPRIKTVVNLSNYRTLTAFIQLANRGCRLFQSIKNFDVIMTKDKSMMNLWQQFVEATQLEVEVISVIEETVEDIELSYGEDQIVQDRPKFANHQLSFDLVDLNSNDEIIELFNRKQPLIANRLTNQEKLTYYEYMSKTLGLNWLLDMPDPTVINITPTLIDANEEESRLRSEGGDIVKNITAEIMQLLDVPYNGQQFGEINKRVWTAIKRVCGLPPNQSIQNLAGIDNYRKIVEQGKSILRDLQVQTGGVDFDYQNYLNRYR